MSWIDWSILFSMLLVIVAASWGTRSYMKGVADFLAAGRVGGRYMLCVAEGIAWIGAISIIAGFETGYKAGFTSLWWQELHTPVYLFISLSGWVIYRYRQTRALTLAQFFEMRYSRNFRIFAGGLQWLAGIINMGIFPAVSARFFVYFCNLPVETTIASVTFPTYWIVMIVLLAAAMLLLTFSGQIAIMVTDFIQGSFTNIVFIVILVLCFLFIFDWSMIIDTLMADNPEMVNPMMTNDVEDFNVWFYLIMGFSLFYNHMAWQGSQGYNASAKTPHEAKMARIISVLRGVVTTASFALLPICAFVFLNHPQFADQTASIGEQISHIDNEVVYRQTRITLAIAEMLPVGLTGMFAAMMLAASVSTLDTYLHSWGSIFVQDVIMPIRKKPLTPKQHIWALRISILFVAVFVLLFSMLYQQTEDILLFFAVTGAIVLGGAGSVIIGGLYWSRGTTPAAYSAMIAGAFLSLGKLVLDQEVFFSKLKSFILNHYPGFVENLNTFMLNRFPQIVEREGGFENWSRIPMNGLWMFGFAMAAAITIYICVSLLTCKEKFNLNKMLHRGEYALKSDVVKGSASSRILKMFGITDEFTKFDKLIYFLTLLWSVTWFFVLVIGTAYALISGNTTTEGWAHYWWFRCWSLLIVAVIVSIWLLIGGLADMLTMFKTLSQARANELDDGRVDDHHNLGE